MGNNKSFKSNQIHNTLNPLNENVDKIVSSNKANSSIEFKNIFKDSIDHWQTTFDSVSDGIFVLDVNHKIERANKSLLQMIGKTENEICGYTCWEVIHGTNSPYCDCPVVRMRESLKRESVIIQNGDIWLEINVDPILDNQGELTGIIHIVRDITEKKKNEEKLQNLNIQLREFASNLQTIREDERASIARDIHDEMGQDLTALKLELSLIESELKDKKNLIDKQFLLNEVIDMQNIVNNSIQKVRELIRKLRPEVLDHLGLIDALKWQAEEFEKRTRIKCLFNSNRKKLKVKEEVSVAIFRIVQEALTNILRHAKANEVKINIRKLNKNFIIKIIDNGIGFSSNIFSEKKSYGIIGMRERASIIGGNFEIKALDGKGTSLILSVPIE